MPTPEHGFRRAFAEIIFGAMIALVGCFYNLWKLIILLSYLI